MNDSLRALDGRNGNVPAENSPTDTLRMTILATMVALGLGAHLKDVIPTETRAEHAANRAAKMAQDGGGY